MLKKLLIVLFLCLVATVFIVVLDSIFSLTSSPRVIGFSPENRTQNVALDSSIIIKFDKPLKRREIQPSIFPEVYGQWKFEDPIIKNHLFRTLVFIPAVDFKTDTQYQIKLDNIKGFGFSKSNSFQFTFKTNPAEEPVELSQEETEDEKKQLYQGGTESKITETEPEVTILPILLDWQDYNLSCEAASLKMALAGKGIFVSETEIMEKIGYDLTSHKGNIWGDPYQMYVGDIDGKMCRTGYGVYWKPVARAALNWREAESFSGWELKDLIREIEKGNPMVVWGVLPTGTLNDCSWYTPEGKYVLAFKETHVRLVIGFIGSLNQPSKIILNDPLTGRIYWSTAYFLENWKIFNYSGVVIR